MKIQSPSDDTFACERGSRGRRVGKGCAWRPGAWPSATCTDVLPPSLFTSPAPPSSRSFYPRWWEGHVLWEPSALQGVVATWGSHGFLWSACPDLQGWADGAPYVLPVCPRLSCSVRRVTFIHSLTHRRYLPSASCWVPGPNSPPDGWKFLSSWVSLSHRAGQAMNSICSKIANTKEKSREEGCEILCISQPLLW